MKQLKNLIILLVFLFATATAIAGGLGHNYIVQGDVYVTIINAPNKVDRNWGFVNDMGLDISVGFITDLNKKKYLGHFSETTEIQFWADGKNKRFYTGKGNAGNDSTFVINGTKFQIKILNDNLESNVTDESRTVDFTEIEPIQSECVDPTIEYIETSPIFLKAFWSSTRNCYILRIKVIDSEIDWTLFRNMDVTIEVTINNSCEMTYNATDEIEYFIKTDKDYIGYRLSGYEYPPNITYVGKCRITKEKGYNVHWLYLNNVNVIHLIGNRTDIKIKLYQDGSLIQAYHTIGIMTTK